MAIWMRKGELGLMAAMDQHGIAQHRREQRLSDRLAHRTIEVMIALVLTLVTAAILIATLSG